MMWPGINAPTLFVCARVCRNLRSPLSERRNVSGERKRHQTVPLPAPVHWWHMWDWQVSLLSGWRVRPQQYFDIGGELHLSVRALIICLRLTEKKHKCVKLSHFAQFLSFHSCTDGRVQPSCYTCDTNEYCANGQCSIDSNTRLPKCMWGVHSFIFVVYQSWLNPLHCFIVCMNISVCIYLCHYNPA